MRLWFQKIFVALIVFGVPFKGFGKDLALSSNINHTGMFLYYIMSKADNTIISPIAISSSLLIAYMGADGATSDQIGNSLHLGIPKKNVPTAFKSLLNHLTNVGHNIQLSSTLWINDSKSIRNNYKKILTKDLGVEIHQVNFKKSTEVANRMNNWISGKTDGKISSIISSAKIDPSTEMILASSLFLKGQWKNPFPTQNTGQENFTRIDGSVVPCQMMKQTSKLYYYENKDTQVVSLPISSLDANYSLIIFLPKHKTDDLYSFYYAQDESKPEGFISYISQLKETSVSLSLPKFAASQKLDLIPLHSSLGINDAITKSANFSWISHDKGLMINKAFEQSAFSINEGGIFATSADESFVYLKSPYVAKATSFVANHPFLFAVYDFDAKLLLFIGECQVPLNASDSSSLGSDK